MSLSISKHCFPDSSKCHNCVRKKTEAVKKETDPKENSKRCGNCHLMTYCDADCQREHWIKVHKQHCSLLSGKTPVKNSTHDAATCPQCIQERESSRSQILSENSPKTTCNFEAVAKSMKKTLGSAFGFHGQGKKCDCSIEHGLQLPFALGEVSGQYLEIPGTGLDPMLAHAFNIVKAMIDKAQDDERKTALFDLLRNIIRARAQLWLDVLVSGRRRVWDIKILHDQVDSLRTTYGATNPWWKILNITVRFIVNDKNVFDSIDIYDSRSFEDPRFQKRKQLNEYMQSQFQNQLVVCEMKMWPNFMLWPQLVNGSLAVLLPPGTRCHSCNDQLLGEMAISPDEPNFEALPTLFSQVGHNGAIKAFCPFVQKPTCTVDDYDRNVSLKMMHDEDLWQEFLEERKLFDIESRDCDFCFKSSLSSHRCSACLTVQYCSLACQKEDLAFHKTVCATWAKDDSKKLLGKGKQKKHWEKVLSD